MANTGNRGFGFPEQRRQSGAGSFGSQQRTGGGSGQEAAGMLGAVQETAQEWASTAAEKAGDAWDTTRQTAQQFASSVSDNAGEAWDSVTNFITRNPLPTILFAFGLGFVAAGALQCMMNSDRRWS